MPSFLVLSPERNNIQIPAREDLKFLFESEVSPPPGIPSLIVFPT